MSLRLEMLQVARLAPAVLGPEATELIDAYVKAQQNPDGGFRDRDGESDLYYTSFAIDVLTSLQVEPPFESLGGYLDEKRSDLTEMDFVHLCCLARLYSALPETEQTAERAVAPVLAAIETYRSADGGYNQIEEADTGSAYACFLAYGAYADHGQSLPDSEGVIRCLDSLATADGAWANDTLFPVPNVPSTAAAITVLRNLRQPIPENTANWLLGSFHLTGNGGGFLPFPSAPIPDLLSTAVALHALDGLQVPFEKMKEPLLDFIDTLWTAEGGFHGTWDDDDLDIEYTYYGLLALGHLAL
ncbi:MAG: terpene cyclase/mutase family protein [Verrucomicrobiae bacterium]|nr:terpene cyclase/mutase family protein [Verrucomicrobiae bacterium]